MNKTTVHLVLVLAILALASIPAVLYVQLSGGIDNIILHMQPAPDPKSPELVAKKNAAATAIHQSFAEINNAASLKSYSTANQNVCNKGQNNSKVRDGYAHRCITTTTVFYGFSGDFRQQMITLEQKLRALGWQPKGDTLQQIMIEYYDKYYGKKNPVSNSLGGKYLVSDLPTPLGGYSKDTQLLDIRYAEAETQNIDYLNVLYQANVDDILKTIAKQNKYMIILSIQKVYFQN
ncbi:MAG TPA: hypothetical protein VFZ48_00885 [Candidatus Saccharimonadales bacterium]